MEKSTINSNNHYLIIPASGIGKRFGGDIPKQYVKLKNNLTILDNSIKLFLESNIFQKIIIVISQDDELFSQSVFAKHPQIVTVFGGRERYLSVKNAVDYLATIVDKDDFIAVHDSVRPCVDMRDVAKLFIAIEDSAIGGLLVSAVSDTIKVVNDGKVQQTIDRTNIYLAQTPQIYRFYILQQALGNAVNSKLKITDESEAIEILGFSSVAVVGSKNNIKITTNDDLLLINSLMNI